MILFLLIEVGASVSRSMTPKKIDFYMFAFTAILFD
jgi:hypothetical protein